LSDLPAASLEHLQLPDRAALRPAFSTHKPRILILYGSLRTISYSRSWHSRLVGCSSILAARYGSSIRKVCLFPTPSRCPIRRCRNCASLSGWSEGQVWVSPERHGAMTGIMKAQIDWIPLSVGSVRPTQGKTLAVMQVSGGSQSFNAINQLRVLGRWMRMITIPNQSSVAKAFQEFDANGRMKASSYYDRVVDVCEELVKFTLLTRDASSYLTDRYSERKEEAEKLEQRVRLKSI
jgi:arsenic resistance protein ArsH